MEVRPTNIPEVLVLEPKLMKDNRGFFYESFNERRFNNLTGSSINFVQENHSKSDRGVLRGLHYQIHRPQGKLIRVVAGEVFDVAVDLRKKSPTFSNWVGVVLSAENKRQLWIPEGFAHGFIVTSVSAECLYKVTEYWFPELERSIIWNDSIISVNWPVKVPILSSKDKQAQPLDSAEVFV